MRRPGNAGEQDVARGAELRVFLGEPSAEPVRIQLWYELDDGTEGRDLIEVEHPDAAADLAHDLAATHRAVAWGWHAFGQRPDLWPERGWGFERAPRGRGQGAAHDARPHLLVTETELLRDATRPHSLSSDHR